MIDIVNLVDGRGINLRCVSATQDAPVLLPAAMEAAYAPQYNNWREDSCAKCAA